MVVVCPEIINTLLLETTQGETDAEERYMTFAGQVVAERYPRVASFFTGLSYAEAVHAAGGCEIDGDRRWQG